MISVELNEHTVEDWKLAQDLKKLGFSDTMIQKVYDKTQESRKNGEVKKDG